MEQKFLVSGLSCEHCVQHLTSELQILPGVKSVVIDLVPQGISTVKLCLEDEAVQLQETQLCEAISEAGDYQLVKEEA